MSQTSTPPRAVLSIRPLSSTGPNYITTTSGSTSAGLQYILNQQQKRLQQRRIIAALNRHNQGQPHNRNQVVFQRFPNNNVVQVRKLVTQQPQQLQSLQNKSVVAAGGGNNGKDDHSSSDSNEEFNNKRMPQVKIRGAAGGGGVLRKPEDEKKLDTGEVRIRMGKDVDISIVRSTEAKPNLADHDDDEDDEGKLVIDEARNANGDDDDEDDLNGGMEIEDEEAGGPEDKSALEMNGQSVDSEYLKHVIETQILNRHKTRITDWDGTKGHMCQSCHETFLTENGLEMHRNRRILHIFFFCRHCNRDLSFFNKCRLLQHLRNHRVTPTVSSLQNYTMIRLLPESEYLHFKYEDCTSSSDDDDPIGSGGAGGGGGGTGSGSGGSTTQASKRSKPSRFRRVARSSVSNDRDSDPPPPTIVTRSSKSPPKEISAKPIPAKPLPSLPNPPSLVGSTTITSIPSSNTVGAIKYAGGSSNSGVNGNSNDHQKPQQQQQQAQRKEQVTVIKSTGSSVIVSTSTAKPNATSDTTTSSTTTAAIINQPRQKPPPQPIAPTVPPPPPSTSPDNIPKIRIKNLSQLIETNNSIKSGHEAPTPEVVRPPVPFSPQIVKVCSTQDPPPTSIPQPVVQQQQQIPQPQSQHVHQSIGSPKMKSEWHCYKCDIDFESGQELFKHLQEAEQQGLTARSLHRCTTDDIVSWSQCQYVYHTKVFHERSVRFMCPGCGHEAPDYNSLLQHACNDCFYISQRARYLCAVSGQKCSFADKLLSVKTEPEIVDHLKKEHSRAILQCVNCTQGFATENWLVKHLADAHNVEFDESKSAAEREALISKATRPLTQCLVCNILFPNGPTYLQHVYLNFHMHILHAKMFECQACLAVFETREQLTTHRNQNESCRNLDPFQMKICLSASTEMDGFPVSHPLPTSEPNSGTSTPQPQAIQMTPTPIKVVANPAAIITAAVTKPIQYPQQQQQQPPLLQASPLQSQSQTQPRPQSQALNPPTIQLQQPPQLQIQPAPQLQIQPQSQIRQLIPQQQASAPTLPLPISIIRPASTSGVPSAIVVISTANASGPVSPGSASQNVRSQPVPAATIYVQKPSTPPLTSLPSSGSTTITSITNTNNTIAPKGQTILSVTSKQPEKRPVNIAPKNQKQQFFDNLLQCQFCERLVIFSSLRKHEDQCCGLSTVAPGLCLCCRQNFGDRKTLARHGITHIKEGLTICLYCNNRRIRPTHPKSTTPTAHENLYALKKHLYSNHTSKLAKFPFQCPICDQTCKDKRQTEFHIKDHQFNYASVDPANDPVPLPATPDEIRQLLRVRKKGEEPGQQAKVVDIYYCPVCKRREFTAELGLSRHLKFVHQRNPRSMDLSVFKKISTSGKFHVLPQGEKASSPAPNQAEEKSEEGKQTVVTITNRSLRTRTPIQLPQRQLRPGTSSSGDVKRKLASMISSTNGNSGKPSTSTAFSSSAFTTRFTSGGIVLRKRLAPSSSSTGTSSSSPNKKPVPAILQKLQPPNTRQRSALTTTAPSLRPPSNFLQTRSSASAKVRKKDGTFACHKCSDFHCKTENEFYEHVKWKHVWPEAEIQKLQYGNKAGLEDPENYWCPECNLVFVAKPSLVRHLKFAHDYISNVEEYMQKIGYDGKKPLKPNQCEVCYLQCSDEREHQQHMRTHGMAFLRLRQQRQQMDREMANKSNA